MYGVVSICISGEGSLFCSEGIWCSQRVELTVGLSLDSILSSTDLITRHAITLQKQHNQLLKLTKQVYQARVSAAIRFKRRHWHTIHNYNFQLGNFVLIRNTAIEKALNCKMWPQYLGPLMVISRNKGGAYIISELDGSVFDWPMAAFQVIPYSARQKLKIPPLEELIDISQKWLQELNDLKTRIPKKTMKLTVKTSRITEDNNYYSRELGSASKEHTVQFFHFSFPLCFYFLTKRSQSYLNTDFIFFQQKHKTTVKNIMYFLSQLWLFQLSIISLLSNFIFSKIAMTMTQSWIHLFPYFWFTYLKEHLKNNKNNHLFRTITKITNYMCQDTSTKEENEVRDEEKQGWLQRSYKSNQQLQRQQ